MINLASAEAIAALLLMNFGVIALSGYWRWAR
jgi:hypothetical protein